MCVFVCLCCHPRSALWLIILSSSPANRTNYFSLSLLLEIAAVSSGANGDREIFIFLVQLTTSRIGYLTRLILTLAICDDYTSYSNVCVVIPFILVVRFVDVPAGVTQEEGHTQFLMHLPSAVLALIFLARRIQSFLSFVDLEVEFCVLTN